MGGRIGTFGRVGAGGRVGARVGFGADGGLGCGDRLVSLPARVCFSARDGLVAFSSRRLRERIQRGARVVVELVAETVSERVESSSELFLERHGLERRLERAGQTGVVGIMRAPRGQVKRGGRATPTG